MKLRIISSLPGHRGVNVQYLPCRTLANADSNGYAYAKDAMKVVHLLDDKGQVIKVYKAA